MKGLLKIEMYKIIFFSSCWDPRNRFRILRYYL